MSVIKKALQELRAHAVAGTVPDTGIGICSNVGRLVPDMHYGDWADFHCKHMRAWPAGTGDLNYPIPPTTPGVTAEYQYHRDPLWEGEQLALRLELIDYLLEQLP